MRKYFRTETAHTIHIWCIYLVFTYIWDICMVNVGKYTSPMDGMGRYFMVFFIPPSSDSHRSPRQVARGKRLSRGREVIEAGMEH